VSLSTAEIEVVVNDLAPRLEGAGIRRVDQPTEHKLVLHVRAGGERYWLLLCAHPRFSRLHLLTRRPLEGPPAAGFCNVVRQHVRKAAGLSLSQVEGDRVVVLEWHERDDLLRPAPVRLIAELVGVGSNLILVDGENRVLGSLFTERSERRQIFPGSIYEPLSPPPSPPSGKALRNRFSDVENAEEDPIALSRAVQQHYAQLEAEAELSARRMELVGLLRTRQVSLQKRLAGVEAAVREAQDAEEVRHKGELLKLALSSMRKGDTEAVVEDLFSPERQTLRVELDPSLAPAENMAAYFRRYRKLKSGREKLANRLKQTRAELMAVQELLTEASEAANVSAVSKVRLTARDKGLLPAVPVSPAKAAERKAGPRRFVSADGLEILVARNARRNDELTFSIARGNDYWLHLRGNPGPHVVVRKPHGQDVPLETLLDAAHLCIYYSKLRGADFAEVAYTQCKHVRRVRGAPGKVMYASDKTLQVRFSRTRLERIMERQERSAG